MDNKYRIALREYQNKNDFIMERETTTIELVVEVEGQIYRVQKQYTKRNKEMDKNKVLKKLLIGKCFSEVGRFLSLSI